MPDLRYGTVAGFAAAAGEANRRRVANVRVAGFAAAVVMILGGSSQWIGLYDASHQLVPTTPTVTADPRPHPAATTPPGVVSALTRSGDPAAWKEPRHDDAVGTVRSTASPAPAGRRVWSTPITTRSYSYPLRCLDVEHGCLYAGQSIVTADRVTLVAAYCTSTEREVTFAEDVEVEFLVKRLDTRRTVWRSLTDRPARSAPHAVLVGAGECYEWRTSWFKRGDDGTEMPPGSYQMFVRARSPEILTTYKHSTFSLP
jgi:hypothetical protein